jgi:hypothetical protein
MVASGAVPWMRDTALYQLPTHYTKFQEGMSAGDNFLSGCELAATRVN